jgi:diacylglycerol kinase
MTKTKFTLRSRITSFKYAFAGIGSMIRNEHNSRIHLIAAVLAVILGLILHLSLLEWVAIIIVIGLVFITELINSAIELLADLVEPETNPKIKRIKDYAAASVLISAIIALIVGGLIFLHNFLTM